jgi:ubiquinone/menaquinone biosynthesis C-methylase UbiE
MKPANSMFSKHTNCVHHHRGKSSERLLDKPRILNELNILPGQIIIDAGCGDGYMAKEFSRMLNGTGKMYALDTNTEAIEILKKETKENNIEPLVADITNEIPIKSTSVNLMYMSTVFHGLRKDQIPHFQKEVERLLKPKATLAILEIKKENISFGPCSDIKYSAEELKQAITLTPKATTEIGKYFYLQLFENTKTI